MATRALRPGLEMAETAADLPARSGAPPAAPSDAASASESTVSSRPASLFSAGRGGGRPALVFEGGPVRASLAPPPRQEPEPATKRVPAGERQGAEGAEGAVGVADAAGTAGAATAASDRKEARPLSEQARKLLEEFSALPDDGELLLQKLLALAGPSPAAELSRALESGAAVPEGPAAAEPAAPAEPQPDERYAAFGSKVLDGEYIVTEPDSRSVFIPVCPRGATEADFRELFSQAGNVVAVQILRGQRGRRPAAVVEYDNRGSAERAVPMLHHRWLRGEQITVAPKRTRRRGRGEEQ